MNCICLNWLSDLRVLIAVNLLFEKDAGAIVVFRTRLMIAEADAAMIHVNRTGMLHPAWGNGSLTSAARKRRLAPRSGCEGVDYCQCMETVLDCLIEHEVARH